MDVLKNIACLNTICSDIIWVRKKNKLISRSSSVDLGLVIWALFRSRLNLTYFPFLGTLLLKILENNWNCMS